MPSMLSLSFALAVQLAALTDRGGLPPRPDIDCQQEQESLSRPEFAVALCTDALRFDPGNKSVRLSRAFSLMQEGKYADAISDLNAVLTKQEDAEAYRLRALAKAHLDDREGALQDFGSSLRLAPNNAQTLRERGHFLDLWKKSDLALADLTLAAKLAPDDFFALGFLGDAYLHQKSYDAAIESYTAALAAREKQNNELPVSVYFLLSGRGVAYYEKNLDDKALADFNRAIDTYPQGYSALFDRGLVYRREKEFEKAIADFSDAILRNPNDAGFYISRALIYRIEGMNAQALADDDHAIGIAPSNGRAYLGRALVYTNMGNFPEAEKDNSEAINLMPDSSTAYNNRCWTRAVIGKDLDAALSDCAKALELGSDRGAPHGNKAFIFLKQGRFTEAIAESTSALTFSDETPEDQAFRLFVRSVAYRKSGDVERAKSDADTAAKLDPQIGLKMSGWGISP